VEQGLQLPNSFGLCAMVGGTLASRPEASTSVANTQEKPWGKGCEAPCSHGPDEFGDLTKRNVERRILYGMGEFLLGDMNWLLGL
jgi:hypothetical protein